MSQQQPPTPSQPDHQWSQPSQPPQYQQQPPQGYVPPQSPYQPPKPKKSRTWLWVTLALIVGLLIGYAAHSGGSAASPTDTATTTQPGQTAQATTKPSAPLKWTTTQTFNGVGAKKTGTFTAPSDWKIVWECSGVPAGLDTAPLFIMVYNSSDNSILDTGVNTMCKGGSAKSTGETEEHQGGQVYLDVNTGVNWTIQVQEMK